MSALIKVPIAFVEAVADLRFPQKTEDRLQTLMDRNSDGILTPDQRNELQALLALGETISLIRARALMVLGKKPA